MSGPCGAQDLFLSVSRSEQSIALVPENVGTRQQLQTALCKMCNIRTKSFTDVRVESFSFFEYFLEKLWRTTPRHQPFEVHSVSPPDPLPCCSVCPVRSERLSPLWCLRLLLSVCLPPVSLSVTEPSFLWPRSNHFIWNKPLLLSKKHVKQIFFPS